jgi:hypothetical protein
MFARSMAASICSRVRVGLVSMPRDYYGACAIVKGAVS